jgi:hypothetical protein
MHTDTIIDIEQKLKLARQAAIPVIVELVSEDKEQRTFVNKTSGTVRQDFLGGTAQRYHEKPVPKVEVPLFDKPVPKDIGRIIKANEDEREIKLTSGTIRTDLR